MAQGNHFLNIPKQEGLFTTIKSGRAGEQRDDSAVEDEDEEETEEDVRLIPRCSPIPRKRGHSIADETAEYMRIRLVLSRRVSFADATGGDLVDVREFVAFDSGDENDDSNREEEEANCRRAYLEPVYRIWPEFSGRSGNDLTHSVRANKVDVESVTPVAEDPLAFDALICVLNVSYHKCVFVRFTMDGWITHTDCPAQYVQGSNQGDTDKFSARLSFSEPYLFNGARIDFVVRYETSECEFWANNSGRNYSVTLLVSHEDTSQVNKLDTQEIRGWVRTMTFFKTAMKGNGRVQRERQQLRFSTLCLHTSLNLKSTLSSLKLQQDLRLLRFRLFLLLKPEKTIIQLKMFCQAVMLPMMNNHYKIFLQFH